PTITVKSRYSKVLWQGVLYLIPSTILVLTGLLFFASTGPDDPHITYWSAYTLARFGQILNYNGYHVEQSSSLLQVALLALLSKFIPIAIVTLGKISSIAFGVASVIAISKLVMRVAGRAAAFVAAMLTAASSSFIYWSYGGLESTLVSLTGICLIIILADYLGAQTRYALLWPTIAMFLFVLVRPETPLLLGCLLSSAIGVT